MIIIKENVTGRAITIEFVATFKEVVVIIVKRFGQFVTIVIILI